MDNMDNQVGLTYRIATLPQPGIRKGTHGPHHPELGPGLGIEEGAVKAGLDKLTRLDLRTGCIGKDEPEGWM